MTTPACAQHHIPMESRTTEPRARCPHCGYMTYHLTFDRCRECGQPMHIEEPEPHWYCPLCAPSKQEQAPDAPGC
jgi:ribosomal protein L37E